MTDPSSGEVSGRLDQTAADDPDTQELPFVPEQQCLPVAGGVPSARYVITNLLGAGATGRVYQVEDQELGRQVAIKVLAGEATRPRTEAFLREARMAAALEHPNIPPIYEVSATALGQVWFSMRRSDGQSLEAAIAQLHAGEPVPLLADVSRRVVVVMHIANALRAAHHKGILHRDIKPSNVMLGRFGEVLLVDWGTASSGATPGRSGPVGTPLYMSPQQAAGSEATVADDIYALGATLFELLTLRPPLGVRAAADFWRDKAAGVIDAPTSEERRTIPRQLLAITMRALATDPAERYSNIDAMRDDLERWQAGQPVSACRETIDERLRRWWRRHARAIVLSIGTVCIVVLSLAAVLGEKLKEHATWGAAVLSEDFTDEGWRDRFQVIKGAAELREGRLVTTSPLAFNLLYPQRLNGPTAIEYDGEMLADSMPCDLSIWWSRHLITESNGKLRPDPEALKIQFGAYDGSYTAIIGADEEHLTWSTIKPEPEQRYRLRLEIVGNRLRFLVDGTEVVSYRDPFPLEGGYFIVYGYYAGKAFDRIRVYNLGIPERLPATAIGDHLASLGELPHAIEAYERVLTSHRGKEIADDARYRQGLCHLRNGDEASAYATWGALADTRHADDVELLRLTRRWNADPSEDPLTAIESLYRRSDRDLRPQVLRLWAKGIRDLAARKPLDHERLRRWLELRDRLFADQVFTDRVCAEVLDRMGEHEEILARFPDQRRYHVLALIALGRAHEAIERYADQRSVLIDAYHETGRWRESVMDFPDSSRMGHRAFNEGRYDHISPKSGSWDYPTGAYALIAQGRLDEALATWPGNREAEQRVLMHRGAFAELVRRYPWVPEGHLGLGDTAQALIAADSALVHGWLALDAAARGEHAAARQHFAVHAHHHQGIYNRRIDGVSGWMEPFWREVTGEADALRHACQRIRDEQRWNDRQRPWHRASYLLGEIDEATFLAQPLAQFTPAELLLLRAARADLAGDHAQAQVDYAAYVALPTWERGLTTPLAEDVFARWRLDALKTAVNPQ